MFDFDPDNRRFAEDLTEQEIFDICAVHLGTMDHRCVDKEDSCVYRADDGSTCALGLFISDREYTPDFEGMSIMTLVAPCYNFPKRLVKHENIFYNLQSIHDDEKNWVGDRSKMKYLLEDLARYKNLSDEVLSNPNLAWCK